MAFSVLDENGMFLDSIKKEDFQVLQDKKPLSISSSETKNSQSLDVAIMIDASVSQEKTFPITKLIVKNFIDSVLRKNDRVAIVRFAGDLSIEQSLTTNFAIAKEKSDKIEIKFPKGYLGGGISVGQKTTPADNILSSTSIWDSIKITTQTAFDNQTENRKVILLFTDGVDTFSEDKLKNVIEIVLQTKIPVYAIGIGDDYYDGVNEKSLKKISNQTGGQFFIPEKSNELVNIFKQIEQSSRSFYEISFTPNSLTKTDKINEVNIEMVNSSLKARKLKIIQPKGFLTN